MPRKFVSSSSQHMDGNGPGVGGGPHQDSYKTCHLIPLSSWQLSLLEGMLAFGLQTQWFFFFDNFELASEI